MIAGITTAPIGAKWLSLGGPASTLGLPTGNVTTAPDELDNPQDVIENFAGGSIYDSAAGNVQVWYKSESGGFGLTGSTPFTINKDDIEQQEAPACAFLSSLSSVAAADPTLLYSHIAQEDSSAYGLWNVQLYIGSEWKTYSITIGTVTPIDPNPTPILGQTAYPGSATQNMWVVAYQRAYLMAEGLTNPSDPGSNTNFEYAGAAMQAITGKAAISTVWTPGQAPSSLTISTLQSDLQDSDAIVVDCPSSSANDPIPYGSGYFGSLVGGHFYSVLGAFAPTVPGQYATVLLRNPWACNPDGNQNDGTLGDSNDPQTKIPDGGYIMITWSQFIDDFNEVAVVST